MMQVFFVSGLMIVVFVCFGQRGTWLIFAIFLCLVLLVLSLFCLTFVSFFWFLLSVVFCFVVSCNLVLCSLCILVWCLVLTCYMICWVFYSVIFDDSINRIVELIFEISRVVVINSMVTFGALLISMCMLVILW